MIKRLEILSFLIFLNVFVTSCATFGGRTISSTNNHLEGAKYNLSQNNSALALESANQVILTSPNDFEAYYVAAQAYQQLNDVNNADANYSKSFELNKDLSNLYDFGLSYANFLCVYKLDYNTSYRVYNQSAILAVKNQSNGLMIANIYTSYAGCLSIQDRDDEAINNYILAMGYKEAPLEAYLGISKIYLKEHNYPSAYYYINLYRGTSSVDLLKVKIAALAGLLASNQNLPNYATLSETLLDYQHQLLKLKNSEVTQSPKPMAEKKTSSAPTAIAKAYDKGASKPAKVDNSIETTNESLLSARVRVINGRKSIVVEPQDTLYSLAKKNNTSLDSLIKINHIHNNQIKVGQTLYLQ